MILEQFKSSLIQIAPFLSIILLEISHSGFRNRIDEVISQYSDKKLFNRQHKKDCEDFAIYTHEIELTILNLELASLSMLFILVGKIINAATRNPRIVIGLILIFYLLIMASARYLFKSKFGNQYPHRFNVRTGKWWMNYGSLTTISVNVISIALIIVIDYSL